MGVGLDRGSRQFLDFLNKTQCYLTLEFSGKLGCIPYSLSFEA